MDLGGGVEMREVTINQRWTLQLPDHRDRGEWWDNWERERLDSMHDLLEPDDLIYYVGAEQGDMPALCASWGCRVILIEPMAHVWPNMSAIWDANDLEPPVASFVGFAGATDHFKENDIWVNWPPESSGATTDFEGFAHLWERDDLPIISLDSFNDSLQLPYPVERLIPRAVSIDVEGSELHVLVGAEGMLLIHQPLVWVSIHPDFMHDLYGQDPQELHDWMELMGYQGEMLADAHEEHWLFRPKDST
jgi:FkbM family methyltransferase